MTATSIRFLPGEVPTVASERLVALVGVHPDGPIVSAVADAVARGGDLNAVLEAVRANAWYGLPDFCLCQRIPGGFRLAFRGPFEIRPDGEPPVEARVEPWADGTVTNDAVTLRYLPSTPPPVAAGSYGGGVVQASIVRMEAVAAAPGPASPAAQPAPAAVSAPSPSLPAPWPGAAAASAGSPSLPAPWPGAAASAGSPSLPAEQPEAAASLDQTMVVPADWLSREAAPQAQTVLAGRCPVGHLTPAFAPECRVCRASLAPQEPVEVPRPDLGGLRLSTGQLVRLDRGAVLGRRPSVPAGHSGEEPRLVVLQASDGAVSAQHLEVVLDYWTVGVRDLGSTNGTEVTQPGRPAVRLRPHELVILEPGARVNLAGSVSFVFDPAA